MTTKLTIDDVMSVLSDPEVVPALVQERKRLADRLQRIDGVLAVLSPAAALDVPLPQTEHDRTLKVVLDCLRSGPQTRAMISQSTGIDLAVVGAACGALRARKEISSNGKRGSAAIWSIVQ